MTDILASIDAALGQRCACGCGQAIAAVSAWFAGPDCQQRWHQARTTNPVAVLGMEGALSIEQLVRRRERTRRTLELRAARQMIQAGNATTLDREAVRRAMRETFDQVVAGMRPLVEAFAAICREVEPHMRRLAEQCAQHGLIAKPLPADPMLRAIELKKRRNTGPQVQQRAPRSLGVGGGR